MSIYDLDFSKTGPLISPPNKRNPKMIAWIGAMLKPMQWVSDTWLRDYRTGSTAALWLNSSTYSKYARVKYNFAIYESVVNGNIGNLPTDGINWTLVQGNFIGISERINYTGNTLTLTYALNKRFGTVFRQPNNLSDIYINNNVPPTPVFVVGGTDASSSDVYGPSSTEFIINGYSFSSFYNFTINVPVAVYNALDPLSANRDKIFRSFVNSIIPAGITYSINTY